MVSVPKSYWSFYELWTLGFRWKSRAQARLFYYYSTATAGGVAGVSAFLLLLLFLGASSGAS